jgi:hypothetical protein
VVCVSNSKRLLKVLLAQTSSYVCTPYKTFILAFWARTGKVRGLSTQMPSSIDSSIFWFRRECIGICWGSDYAFMWSMLSEETMLISLFELCFDCWEESRELRRLILLILSWMLSFFLGTSISSFACYRFFLLLSLSRNLKANVFLFLGVYWPRGIYLTLYPAFKD